MLRRKDSIDRHVFQTHSGVAVKEYLEKLCLQIIYILFEIQVTSENVNTWEALPTLQLNTMESFGCRGSVYKSNLAAQI